MFSNIASKIEKLCKLFFENNYELYMVGGAVRDIFSLKLPHDYDFATNATPDQMLEMVKASNAVSIIPTGVQYGTVTFRIDNESFEVTTYRADGNYSDGRRPDHVTFSTNILDDLSRRDFTINAIAINMLSDAAIECKDPYYGRKDLESKLVKTVGDPVERFTEDGLRILRAIRFKYKFGFEFDKATYNAIIDNWHLLKHVSQERITSEFLMILEYATEPKTAKEKKLLSGLLQAVFPEVKRLKWLYKDCLNCFQMKGAYNRLACLFRNYAFAQDALEKLKLSNKEVKCIMQIILGARLVANETGFFVKDLFLRKYAAGFADPYYIPRLLVSEYGIENAENAFELFRFNQFIDFGMDRNANQVIFNNIRKVQNDALHISDLKINGNDLVSLGFSGREIGGALDYLLDQVLHNQAVNTKKELKNLLVLKYAKLKKEKKVK